ncbi:hypothetical protein BD309DRAFT_1083015 [Dichomitus squalens]|nr:hypothetical protein BD309DRAFT_1083015 [Dichomitus squalens]
MGMENSESVHPTEHEMMIRLERLRMREALNARDAIVSRLAEACASVRQKTEALAALQEEKEALQRALDRAAKRDDHGADKENLCRGSMSVKSEGAGEARRQLVGYLKAIENKLASLKLSEGHERPTVSEIENTYKVCPVYLSDHPPVIKATSAQAIYQQLESIIGTVMKVPEEALTGPLVALRDSANVNSQWHALLPGPLTACVTPSLRDFDAPESPWTPLEGERSVALPSVSTAEKIEARYAILASLPLPSDIPDDSLTPIFIPAPYTLHDVVSTTSGLLRMQLGNYRVFQQSTTTWCPEREEHGYFLTPAFKCNTNPRVSTAHRWSVVDMSSKLDKPTECFYNKDGKWYYAGIYKSFRLDDLCTQEWECLSQETSQVLIKETLVGRKNTSPQNLYETGQLYSVGALKVACIGLQCIGFNSTLYRGLLEHAKLCMQTGKWRAQTGPAVFSNSPGLGLGASAPSWGGNLNANVSTDAIPTRSGPGSPVIMGHGAPTTSGMNLGGRTGHTFGSAPVPVPGLGLGAGPGQPSSGVRTGMQHIGPQDLSAPPGLRSAGNP